MPVIFVGQIIPPLPGLKSHNAFDWLDDDEPNPLTVAVLIEDSVVRVECSGADYRNERKVQRMTLRAYDTSQAIVDVVSFALGSPHIVHFHTIQFPDEQPKNLTRITHDLIPLVTSFALDTENLKDVLMIVLTERNLLHAMRDMIDGLMSPRKIVPHCAKAVETLRNLLAPNLKPEQAWGTLQNTLRADKPYIKKITDESRAPRHGDHQLIVRERSLEVAKRTWILMDRYLQFRKRGSQPLPAAEFPLLTG